MGPTTSPPLTLFGHVARFWRWLKIGVVTLFVVWNLFFLAFRNPLDLWWKEYLKKWCEGQRWWQTVEAPFDKVDRVTKYYGKFFGIDQSWSMFTPEMARRSPFLSARIEFTDDSSILLLSENEPADFNHFFRFGGWRQRKLEDNLWGVRNDLSATCDELPLWEAYARWSIRRRREQSPDDDRTVRRVVLLGRPIYFPKPGSDPREFDEPSTRLIGYFGPDGTFVSKAEDE